MNKKKKFKLRKEVKDISLLIAGIAVLNAVLAGATVRLGAQNQNETTMEFLDDNAKNDTKFNAVVVTRVSDGKTVGYKELIDNEESPETGDIQTLTSESDDAKTAAEDEVKPIVVQPADGIIKAQPSYDYDAAPQEYVAGSEYEPDMVYEEETYVYDGSNYDGAVLNPTLGIVYGPSGKETYYNLDMSGVVNLMRGMGNADQYWIREDGVKMLGDYVIVAANLDEHPRGSFVETSLGTGIVCDTGYFAYQDPYQIDVATAW